MTTTIDLASTATLPVASTRDLTLRLLEHGESAAVLAVFAGMGRRSRELRFLSPKPRLTDSDVRRLTAVDDRDHVAYVASPSHEDRPIGIGRFIRDKHATESAEVAVAVVDAWQGRGVGTRLMRTLARHAAGVGIRRFTVLVSRENLAVLRMLAQVTGPVALVHSDRWATEYTVSLEDLLR